MSHEVAKRRVVLWWTLTIVVAVAFFLLALSDTVYEVTSPPGPLQILLRKSYSIAAFSVVGYCLSRALQISGRNVAVTGIGAAVAVYSLGIEVAQALIGAHEGLGWNAVDVVCGLIGGFLGGLARRRIQP